MDPGSTNHISGAEILKRIHRIYAPYRADLAARSKMVTIIRVEAGHTDPEGFRARAEAARISAAQKKIAFSRIGLDVDAVTLPPDVAAADFVAVIEQGNDNPAVMAIIVQLPVPPRLVDFVQYIEPSKDIDALVEGPSVQQVCATAEGIWRVTQPFTADTPHIAVVGANGFVGRGVIRRLVEHKQTVTPLDIGADLASVSDADIVISVVGKPGLLDGRHLRAHHRLVVDSGFYPSSDGTPRGDVHADAVGIPQNITPVPGGVGPVEMAVLIERAVHTGLGISEPIWTYPGRYYRSRADSGVVRRPGAQAFPHPPRLGRAVPPAPGTDPPAAPPRPDRGPRR